MTDYCELLSSLKQEYKARKNEIRARLAEFRRKLREPEEELFAELGFCLFTPQSKALSCDRAMSTLKQCGLLMKGSRREVSEKMHGVRFRNQKAGYLVEARAVLLGKKESLKDAVSGSSNSADLREWLVKNVRGLGYKEASHFLRNVGRGEDLAILDRHVLKNLVTYGVLEEVPRSLTRKRYLDIENKMRAFSKEIGVSMEELDLLFWSMETGRVFK